MKILRSYLAGEWIAGDVSTSPVQLFDPSSEATVAHVGNAPTSLAPAFDYARSHGRSGLAQLSFAERGQMLKGLSKALRTHRDELLDLSRQTNGTTVPDGSFDIDGASGTLAYYGSIAPGMGDNYLVPEGDGVQLAKTEQFWGQHFLMPRPGVAVHINAFNFPVWGFAEKAACALLAGMPVITKPATATGLLAERAIEVLLDSGHLPEGALQLLSGPAGDLLDQLGPYDVLAFTGSATTAQRIASHPHIAKVNPRLNIEADSLNAAVLGPEAPETVIELMVRDVKREMTQKAGQKCTAVRRILVPHDQMGRVSEELVAALEKVVVGDPAEEAVRMGPLASENQLEDVLAGIRELTTEGEILCGGAERVDAHGNEPATGYFVRPTLLRAGSEPLTVVHEREVFGPVATLVPYSGEATEAAELVGRGGGSLVTSVYTDDTVWLRRFAIHGAATSGRLYVGSSQSAQMAPGSGVALPQTLHGGPGRAGAGEELGGLRGVHLYLQRVAFQGAREQLDAL